MTTTPARYEVVEVLTNPNDLPVTVWFEPWGMPHLLPQQQSLRLLAVGDEAGKMEIERREGEIVVYGWPGARLRTYCDGHLVADLDVPPPRPPPGLSMRAFIRGLFGGAGGSPKEP